MGTVNNSDVSKVSDQKNSDSKTRIVSWTELESHTESDSLWIAVEGKAYDVTEWSLTHPGGVRLLHLYAGKDATDPFLAYHPSRIRSLLPKFLGEQRLYMRSGDEDSRRQPISTWLSSINQTARTGHGILSAVLPDEQQRITGVAGAFLVTCVTFLRTCSDAVYLLDTLPWRYDAHITRSTAVSLHLLQTHVCVILFFVVLLTIKLAWTFLG